MQREVEDALSAELVRRHSFDLPARWVESTLERVIAEAAGAAEVPEALKQELEPRYRPGVERSLRRSILLEAIARQEGLEVSDEEVAEEIQRIAQSDPRRAARVRAYYQSPERRESLQDSLRERKALDWLVNAAEIQEETVGAGPLVVPAGR
jgi:trigger factor